MRAPTLTAMREDTQRHRGPFADRDHVSRFPSHARESGTTCAACSRGCWRSPAAGTRSSRSDSRARRTQTDSRGPGGRARRAPLAATAARTMVAVGLEQAWTATGGEDRRPARRLHSSDWMYPPQRGGARVTTVHDLVPLRFPSSSSVGRRGSRSEVRERGAHLRPALRRHRFTASELRGLLEVPEDRIAVAYPGVDPIFTPEGRGRTSADRTSSPSRPASRARTSRRSSRASGSFARLGRS